MNYYKSILLSVILTIGNVSFAQEKPDDKPAAGEIQKGGPRLQRGMPKELRDCLVCQTHRNHMKDKHPDFVRGPQGPRGKGPGPRNDGPKNRTQ